MQFKENFFESKESIIIDQKYLSLIITVLCDHRDNHLVHTAQVMGTKFLYGLHGKKLTEHSAVTWYRRDPSVSLLLP